MSFLHRHQEKNKHHHHNSQHGDLQAQQQHGIASYGSAGQSSSHSASTFQQAEHKHKRNEHMAEVGTFVAGAFAKHEHDQVRNDPANAGKHRKEERLAEVAAAGFAAYALHEHNQIRHDHKAEAKYNKEQKKHRHGLF